MGLSSTSPSPAPCLEILSPLPESRLSMSSLVSTAILKGSSPARLIPLCTRPWLELPSPILHTLCAGTTTSSPLVLAKQFAKASKNAADYTTGGAAPASNDDDDDVDLFGSDDEEDSEEKKRITEERLKAYAEKKSKKPALIAKTSCLFDVKPWDDETDMDKMLELCKTIEMDGL